MNLQRDAMKKEGCNQIYEEKISGASKIRPVFQNMISNLKSGDEVIVWDIDRLGRTTLELITLIDSWNENNIKFKCIAQPILDTTTPHGELVFRIFAVLAEHERKRIIQRTKAGLEAAKARGKKGGRKPGLTERYRKLGPSVKKAYQENMSISDIRETFNIPSIATVYKILNTLN